MNREYQFLHQDMLADINRCMKLELSEVEKIESCFWIAHNYFDKLKELIKEKGFKNIKEEVDFFRNVKPKFTCYIEYFVLLNEAVPYVPKQESEQIDFWQREWERIERFSARNQVFIEYYEKGNGEADGIYFRMVDKERSLHIKFVSYDSDPKFSSLQDHVVRGYLAYKMYGEYVRERLESLTPTLSTSSGRLRRPPSPAGEGNL